MRLLFFLHSLSFGGAERATATLANYWAEKGWAVTVVTVAGSNLDFYALDPRIRRTALDMAIYSRHPGDAVVNNVRRVWSLRQILRCEKPDVAVAMMATANATLALAGRLAGVASVGSERSHPPMLPLGRLWHVVRRRSYPLLAGLVAQTEASAAWLREHAPSQRVAVIPNPVKYPLVRHFPHLTPSEVIAPRQAERVLLAIGRLEAEKGFERLLSAFAATSGRNSQWLLVILGEGRLEDALRQQAIDLGISDRVALPGAVGNVGEWFDAADLYALTSRFEGFPNALLEALAHGVPSLAVDCETGPGEIVRDEVDGLLVPQDAPEALTAALDRMMSDPVLRARFAGRAVEARERFAVERVAGQWEALFDKVL